MKRIYYSVFVILLIVGTYFYTNWKYSLENVNEEMLEEIKQESYSGTITKKYIHEIGKYPEHVLELTKKREIKPWGKVWNKASVGDSIVKIKGEDYATIYRKDKSIDTFDYAKSINEEMKEE